MVIVFIQKFSMGQVFISFMPVRPLAGETCFTWNNDLIFPVFYQNSLIFQAILKENSPQRQILGVLYQQYQHSYPHFFTESLYLWVKLKDSCFFSNYEYDLCTRQDSNPQYDVRSVAWYPFHYVCS